MNGSAAQSRLPPATPWDDPAGPLADLRRINRWPIWLLLAATTWIAHGWSLHSGLFLDDHWHQSRLSAMGWSIDEMLQATTLEPERFMEAWWQDRSAVWQYSRPVSVFVMKVVHELTDGHIPTHHAVSVLLHFLTACMVFQLCLMLTHNRSWASVGGMLFVVYSHGVFAVSWLASQNVVLQTALTVAALLLYIRASGLYVGPVDAGRPINKTPPLNRTALGFAFVLWVLAMFSRENAVMLPGIMLAFDWAYGGRGHLWARRNVYLLFGVVTLSFLFWRLMVFNVPMPDVYYRHAGDDGYVLWCVAKLLHYLCSSVWLSPMTVGPSGRINPFSEVPGDCLLMIVILSVMAAGYYFTCRHLRGLWIWPFWLLLALLPIVPVMATTRRV